MASAEYKLTVEPMGVPRLLRLVDKLKDLAPEDRSQEAEALQQEIERQIVRMVKLVS